MKSSNLVVRRYLFKILFCSQVVFIAALSVSASWAIKVKKEDEPKDKREAAIGYPSHYQGASLGHGDASAISVGAGYSVGGAKPSFSLGHGGEGGLQLSSEGLPASGHATIQLAPITLQSGHGFASSDLSQLMSQLSHGLNSGAISLQTGESYQPAAHGEQHGAQELSLPQYTFGAPQIQQYAVAEQPSVPSYAAGTKGLGSYSTGPVLFSPSDSQGHAPTLSYGAPSGGHSLGGSSGSGHSFGSSPSSGHAFVHAPSSGHSYGGPSSGGHSFGGHSFGNGAINLGSSGHSLPAISLNDAVHSFGGAYKGFGSGYGTPSKTSFKPSAFLGASTVQGDSGHGLAALSGSYGTPSFGSFGGSSHGGLSLSSAGHGASLGGSFGGFGGGSSKFIAPSYLPPKSEGFSSESLASFSSDGHSASPPGTTYGIPTSSYGHPSNAAHAASSSSPQYYVPSKSSFPSFGGGSASFKAPYSGHSLSSFSSGPKHSFGGHSSHGSRYASPKDIQGAHSESSYNTIKYSEELKPRVH